MASQETPDWQPINKLPLFTTMIDEMLQDAQEQYETLGETRSKPWVLDDYTVTRLIKVYTDQRDEVLELFEKQLKRWEGLSLTPVQREEVERLSRQLENLRTVITDILALADELKNGTIERQLDKDNAELGLEVLFRRLGKM